MTSLNLTFKPELYTDIKEELMPILHDHWNEVQKERYGYSLNIAPNYIESFQNSNNLIGITGRTGEGELKAYSYGITAKHPLCVDTSIAFVQGIFIDKEYRGQGLKFIDYVLTHIKDNYSVNAIDFSTAGNQGLVKLLKVFGFEQADVSMIRRI